MLSGRSQAKTLAQHIANRQGMQLLLISNNETGLFGFRNPKELKESPRFSIIGIVKPKKV